MDQSRTTMNKLSACAALGLAACLIAPGIAIAQDKTDEAVVAPQVAATIDGDPIYVNEIDAMLLNLQKNRQVNPQTAPIARAGILDQIISRRLAERVLRRDETYIKEAEIEKEMDKYKTQAYGMRMTLEQYVAKRRVTLDTLRHEAAWQLGWAKYLDAKLGEALEEYYRAHKKELDGTQIRASHILFRSDRFNEPISHLVQRADKVRQDIEAGKISFDEAVAKYSAGPSRNAKGDLGFFPRYGPMSEEFAKAAFELEKGQISKPVTSAFGVHLITVTDVKPGTRQWTEAVSQIKSPASLELFEKLANEERDKAKIEFTGTMPYFKPGTKELVLPGVAAPQ
jgi:parvulin-like peptidyl-prolyl isomerase